MTEARNIISFDPISHPSPDMPDRWRVTIGPEKRAFDFDTEAQARLLVQAFEEATGLLPGYVPPAEKRPGRTETEADCEPGERLWTVRAHVDAWAVYENVIAAASPEDARQIMKDSSGTAWGDPEYSEFDHTEFAVDDDQGNTDIELK